MPLSYIAQIGLLVKEGILGPEYPPEEKFWRWPVEKPEKLPPGFQQDYEKYGEIRWYGHEAA